MHTLLSIITRVVDVLLPQMCSGCKKLGGFLCADCLLLAPQAEPINGSHERSASFITAIFDYRNPAIRHVIWRFKYGNARGISKYFGRVLYDSIIGGIHDSLLLAKSETFLLVPIPLHKKRLHERGYNQSELLAREIIKYDSGKIFKLEPQALFRTRKTLPQAKRQKRAARFENLRGAFSASPDLVRGKHIILIDDVTTTGATLSEARKVLIKAGAKTVSAYTVAH